ncbi:hypothetical protein RF11_13757 [Thelohanellus kitauei]|uniref:Uncharacterized protein n=1 Tax=Thelohanellus kitauei TaxID=669202 RepID=A0A0C2N1J2_THEKT|nr:hypothetical protein RF11_13757 [Thelohanellus kitauei]
MALDFYILKSQMNNIYYQMEAIRCAIYYFLPQCHIRADLIFIQHFSHDVYKELQRMSEGDTNVERYQDKKMLFFDIFTFIFRNHHLVSNLKAISFLQMFLKFIKTRDPGEVYNPS